MPQSTETEKSERKAAMQQGLKVAIDVPFKLVKTVNGLWPTLIEIAEVGNINCKSDLQVAARCLLTAVHGAVHNVEINMKDLEDQEFVEAKKDECAMSVDQAEKGCKDVLDTVGKRSS